jgi:hypothetical protein
MIMMRGSSESTPQSHWQAESLRPAGAEAPARTNLVLNVGASTTRDHGTMAGGRSPPAAGPAVATVAAGEDAQLQLEVVSSLLASATRRGTVTIDGSAPPFNDRPAAAAMTEIPATRIVPRWQLGSGSGDGNPNGDFGPY